MQISISSDTVNFSPIEVKKLDEFLEITKKYNWSPGLFRNNYRNKANFIQCECIGLDVDNDEDVKMSLREAVEAFKEYKHIIIPSKSHQRKKNGEVKDRFRVVLFLKEPIRDESVYSSTWQSLKEAFPAIDPACRDTSRFFYPSQQEVVSFNKTGRLIEPVYLDPSGTNPPPPELSVDFGDDSQKGELSRKTLKFMLSGARPGSRHRELYKAARDYHQNAYTKEQFITDLQAMIDRTGNWSTKTINEKDISTIEDAFRVDPKYAARYTYEKAFLFEPVGEILANEERFEWLIEDLWSVGGCGIIAGDPKAGKSTLIRQAAKSIARGEPFLGRKTKQGTVYIMALEEQKSLLRDQLKAAGVTKKDPIRIHVGSPLSLDILETLEDELSQNEVKLLIVDTLQLGLRIKELQNYTEVTDAITPFRDLARATGTYILFVHHNNKMGVGTNSISGSKGIAGAMDQIMLFQKIKNTRFLTSEGRGIKKPFYQHELIYDSKT